MTFAQANSSRVKLKFCLMRIIPVEKFKRIFCIFPFFVKFLLIFYILAECKTNLNYCKNGGSCDSNEVTIWCTCKERFSGPKCEDQAGNFYMHACAYMKLVRWFKSGILKIYIYFNRKRYSVKCQINLAKYINNFFGVSF